MVERIDFAGLTFYGDEPSDAFAVTRMTGWYDGAPIRRSIDDRPVEDGAFDVDRIYRGARVISVEGDWVGSTIEAAYQARDELSALQADGVPGVFTVTDSLGVRSCQNVTLVKEPVADDVISSPFFEFAFDVVARDPRKYGPEVSASTGLATPGTGAVWPADWDPGYEWGSGGTSGRATVSNVGRFTSWPVLEVTGGLAGGVELVEVVTGSVLRLDRVVPLGSTVVFDGRRGRAYLDVPSNDVTGFLTRRDWWPVPASQSRTVQLNPLGAVTGTPTLTVRVSPAF